MKYLAVVLTLALLCSIYVESKSSGAAPANLRPEVEADPKAPENQEKMRVMRETDLGNSTNLNNSTDLSSAGTLVLPSSEQNSTETALPSSGVPAEGSTTAAADKMTTAAPEKTTKA